MTHRLLMICAQRSKRLVFPGGGEAGEAETGRPRRPSGPLPRADRVWRGPDAITRRTADVLGVDAEVREELAEIDFGSWRGRSLDDVAAADPAGFQSWIADPSTAPHGGESIETAMARAAGWLDACGSLSGRTIAIAPVSVVKVCLLKVLRAPPASFPLVDLEPLARILLVSDGRRWVFRSSDDR